MKAFVYISSFILIATLSSCEYVSEVRFKEAIVNGNKMLDSNRYKKALDYYTLAKNYNDSSYLSYYNAGYTLNQLFLMDSSSMEYQSGLIHTNDSLINSNIYYQLGNINLKRHVLLENQVNDNLLFMDSIQGNEEASIQERIRTNIAVDSLLKTNDSILKNQEQILQSAKQHYISSLSYNHLNDSSQYNYIYTLHLLQKEKDSKGEDKKDEKKKEPTKFALKKKEEALKLIKNNEFKRAYNLLNNALQQDETIGNFNQLMQKLKDITEIIDKHAN